MELLNDYGLQIRYHPEKANVVADALSRKIKHNLNIIVITQINILRELEDIGIELVSYERVHALLLALEVPPSLLEDIKLH